MNFYNIKRNNHYYNTSSLLIIRYVWLYIYIISQAMLLISNQQEMTCTLSMAIIYSYSHIFVCFEWFGFPHKFLNLLVICQLINLQS